MTLAEYLKTTGEKAAAVARRSKLTRGGISRLLHATRTPSLAAAWRIHEATNGKVSLGDWPKTKAKPRRPFRRTK